MGDIWPYGRPAYYQWNQVFNYLSNIGQNETVASTMAAIASAESGLDYRVINDTPSTGDYSVGLWQINYYGSLYSGRARAYGTPRQLVEGGIKRQARAMLGVLSGQGFTAWSTYNSGAYLQFLHGFKPGSADTGPGHTGPVSVFEVPAPNPSHSESWDKQIHESAVKLRGIAGIALNHAKRIQASYHG